MEHVTVRTAVDGKPLSVTRAGREWWVAADPVHWFERTAWWEDQLRMERGHGYIDVEVWRVQARVGRNPRTPLTTFEIVHDPNSGAWAIRSESTVTG